MSAPEFLMRPEFAHGAVAMDADRGLSAGAKRVRSCRLKRALDVFGAVCGLIMLSPLLLIVAAMIRLESPGSPIFCQRRSGLDGSMFVIYKFRSMRVCEDGPEVVQASRSDDRITAVGRFIRRTSIDELPQLLNILKGEMSLVGPRPHALAHDEYYALGVPGYNSRFMVKPGLTGLAQVSGLRGRTEELRDMAARVQKDLEYIRIWTLWTDLTILFRTVLIVAYHPAAY